MSPSQTSAASARIGKFRELSGTVGVRSERGPTLTDIYKDALLKLRGTIGLESDMELDDLKTWSRALVWPLLACAQNIDLKMPSFLRGLLNGPRRQGLNDE